MKSIEQCHSERVPAQAGTTRNLIFFSNLFEISRRSPAARSHEMTRSSIIKSVAHCHSDGAWRRGISPRRRAKCYPFEGEAERMFGRGGSPANAGRPRRPTLHPQAEPKKI